MGSLCVRILLPRFPLYYSVAAGDSALLLFSVDPQKWSRALPSSCSVMRKHKTKQNKRSSPTSHEWRPACSGSASARCGGVCFPGNWVVTVLFKKSLSKSLQGPTELVSFHIHIWKLWIQLTYIHVDIHISTYPVDSQARPAGSHFPRRTFHTLFTHSLLSLIRQRHPQRQKSSTVHPLSSVNSNEKHRAWHMR